LVAGLLIGAGFFTRSAAFIASGEMAVAYFWIHQPRGLWPVAEPPAGNGGLLAILFCFGFFLLVFTGGGSFSVDALRGRDRSVSPPAV
jgi:putative oxidoreductase